MIIHCINKPFERGHQGPTLPCLFLWQTHRHPRSLRANECPQGEALPNSPEPRLGAAPTSACRWREEVDTQTWRKPTYHQVPPFVPYSDNVPPGSATAQRARCQVWAGGVEAQGAGIKGKGHLFYYIPVCCSVSLSFLHSFLVSESKVNWQWEELRRGSGKEGIREAVCGGRGWRTQITASWKPPVQHSLYSRNEAKVLRAKLKAPFLPVGA